MVEFFQKLFATDFMPHGYCLRLPEVIWLHQVSDLTIALSYFLIPLALIYIVRKRKDLVYPGLFWLFGLFILSCGTTHLLAVYVLWNPAYRLDGLVKAITALVSFPTAIILIRMVPKVLLLPSAEQLRQQNAALAKEIADRRRAEAEIRRLNEQLESRVGERTRELEQSNRELQRVNQDLGLFAWAASHDLQEPLRMVTLYSQLAVRKEGERLSPDGKEYLRIASDGALRMQRLVRDLLDYTEVNAAPQAPSELCDPAAALEEARANLETAFLESGATLSSPSNLPQALPIAHGRLVQLFQNLISNALKYRRPDVQPCVEIRMDCVAQEWRCSVSDNGIGIDPQFHKQIFGLFKRLEQKTARGSGLGLAICQRIVERHGGRIWVESRGEGHGSTFYFTLPAALASEESKATTTCCP